MPSPAKSLILCVHAHQPVGNFDHVFAEAYEKCYKPFFDVLEKHPRVSVNCHFSGSLIDWLEKNRPDFLKRLARMASAGQLEFLGGGYYEPIFGAIPENDLLGQIEKMRGKLTELFGRPPAGCWLTERVWDPHLVRLLGGAGVEFTVVDDFHLQKAGVKAPVTGYYQTKEGERSLDLFASLKELRYLMPFRQPPDTLDFVRSIKGGPENACVFADDVEKFGLWPGTHAWVYKEGWLDKFFTALEAAPDIQLYTFSAFRRAFPAKKAVRVPHASYGEMMEWSGGRFYNFFSKYPESGYMHDRMMNLSERLAQVTLNGSSAEAVNALYRAQCNCAYWHGVFGGLYLHHLRSAIFENLIHAERLLSAHSGSGRIACEKLASGDRWRLSLKDATAYFNPSYGAALEELDSLRHSVNLLCSLQRRPETYHKMLLKPKFGTALSPSSIHQLLGAKESGLEKHLFYDGVRRLSFMDHFFEREATLDEFRRSRWKEAGDFVSGAYTVSADREKERLHFERSGFVRADGRRHALKITKTVMPEGDAGVSVNYRFENTGRHRLETVFGAGFNFSIGETAAAAGIVERGVTSKTFEDGWRGIRVSLATDRPSTLLGAAVETVSESECGLEKTYQGLAVLCQAPLRLGPGEACEQAFSLKVT